MTAELDPSIQSGPRTNSFQVGETQPVVPHEVTRRRHMTSKYLQIRTVFNMIKKAIRSVRYSPQRSYTPLQRLPKLRTIVTERSILIKRSMEYRNG